LKEVNRKLKEQDKEEARARKEEEKATKAEMKRAAKEDRRKSKETRPTQAAVATEPVTTTSYETETTNEPQEGSVVEETSHAAEEPEPARPASPADRAASPAGYAAPAGLRTSMEMQQQERLDYITDVKEEPSSGSPDSPNKGVKSWFKTKFGRRTSRGQKSDSRDFSNDKPFVGGAALTGTSSASAGRRDSSVRDVTTTGGSIHDVDDEVDDRPGRTKRRASSVSSVAAVSAREENELSRESSRDDEFEEARDHFNEDSAPSPTFAAVKSTSPVRDSKFHEVI